METRLAARLHARGVGRPSEKFRPWFVIGLTFPNLLSIPLVFALSLCEQRILLDNGSVLLLRQGSASANASAIAATTLNAREP